MARKLQVSQAVRSNRPRTVKVQMPTSTRSPSPPPMLRPGAVELPEPLEATVPLAAVAHSMQIDARRKFAATYEDITQYMDKCEYLFEYDDFYDKSYKSLAKAVTELNKIGTDAQLQEREQLFNGLLDWLNTSSFTLEVPTHGAINEHQLIESGQTTRDVLVKMLLGLERLRALHITIIDKVRSAAEMAIKQSDKTQNKQQLLKMVDDSSFVWRTAAAEIVQLLHDERSKGDELVELYADKIRYLMGELEAQSNMIQELRAQVDQQTALPLKFHDLDMKTKQAKHEMLSRQAKQMRGSQQQTTSEDVDDEHRTAAAVSTLPDFNKQLVMTLQNELEECRRNNASAVARGHEAAAKIRFLTEESNRKDKQIAQLQANIVKLKTETREVEPDSQHAGVVTRKDSESHQRKATQRMSSSKTMQRGRPQLQDTDDDDNAMSRMKLTQIIAAAKRQRQPSQPPQSATAAASQQAVRSTDAFVSIDTTASRTDSSRAGRNTTPTKLGKQTRALRGARGKVDAANRAATAAAAPDKSQTDVPTFQDMGNFWQQSALKEWTPVDTSVTSTEMKTAAGSAGQQTIVHGIDMNEAIEMTKLFVAGSKSQQQQQPQQPQAVSQRKSVEQQRRPGPTTATHIAAITPQLFAETSATKAPTTATFHQKLQQRAEKSLAWPADTPSVGLHAAESVSTRQQRARTAAEAAKQRAARLSVVLFHSDDGASHKPVMQSPFSATFASKPAAQQQQQQRQQNVATTKSKARAKAEYDLVGFNMHNLAQQAKLLEHSSLPTRLN